MFIGITERGDAGLDFGWENNLQPANIIISKNLNDKLINLLVKHKDCIIFHYTVTGLGGTELEPNVPSSELMLDRFAKLIKAGFPEEQIVLRVDPIIPHKATLGYHEHVLQMFQGSVKRVRYSFLDMYPHVKKRFIEEKIGIPYQTFHAPKHMIQQALDMLKKYDYEYESCAENTMHKLGCISQKDIRILGKDTQLSFGNKQRQGCLCPSNKYELLSNRKRCPHQCLYCYWQD